MVFLRESQCAPSYFPRLFWSLAKLQSHSKGSLQPPWIHPPKGIQVLQSCPSLWEIRAKIKMSKIDAVHWLHLPADPTRTRIRRCANSVDTIRNTDRFRTGIGVIESGVRRLFPPILTNYRSIEVAKIRQSFLESKNWEFWRNKTKELYRLF